MPFNLDALIDALAERVAEKLRPELNGRANGNGAAIKPRLLTVEQAGTYLSRSSASVRLDGRCCPECRSGRVSVQIIRSVTTVSEK